MTSKRKVFSALVLIVAMLVPLMSQGAVRDPQMISTLPKGASNVTVWDYPNGHKVAVRIWFWNYDGGDAHFVGTPYLTIDGVETGLALSDCWSSFSTSNEDDVKGLTTEDYVGTAKTIMLNGQNVGTARFFNVKKNQGPHTDIEGASDKKWNSVDLELNFNNSMTYAGYTVGIKGSWQDKCDNDLGTTTKHIQVAFSGKPRVESISGTPAYFSWALSSFTNCAIWRDGTYLGETINSSYRDNDVACGTSATYTVCPVISGWATLDYNKLPTGLYKKATLTRGHTPNKNAVTVDWSGSDYNTGKCKITVKCSSCNEVIETRTGTVTSYICTASTCTSQGQRRWKISGTSTYLGEYSYNSGTYYDAKLSHVFTAEEPTSKYLCSAATCVDDAKYYYKCQNCNEKSSTTYSLENTALGHGTGGYTKIELNWNGSNASTPKCTFKVYCGACDTELTASDGVKLSVAVKEHVDATCTAAGHTIYTGTLTYAAKSSSDNLNITRDSSPYVIDATGHGLLGFTPTYDWEITDQQAKCHLSLSCKDCKASAHEQDLAPELFPINPTCTLDGKNTWKAYASYTDPVSHVEFCDTAQKETVVPALGHDVQSDVCVRCGREKAAYCDAHHNHLGDELCVPLKTGMTEFEEVTIGSYATKECYSLSSGWYSASSASSLDKPLLIPDNAVVNIIIRDQANVDGGGIYVDGKLNVYAQSLDNGKVTFPKWEPITVYGEANIYGGNFENPDGEDVFTVSGKLHVYNATTSGQVSVLTRGEAVVDSGYFANGNGYALKVSAPVSVSGGTFEGKDAAMWWAADAVDALTLGEGKSWYNALKRKVTMDAVPIYYYDGTTVASYKSALAKYIVADTTDDVPGDVNGDGDVDIVDINCIVDIMLGNTTAVDYRSRADINNDGAIDVVDINCVIQVLLGN